ncbi:MAG TPA: hypothetical protein ENI66_01630, partial [Candidatus Yonathbacteria bacterium]|nr:hypothetical protein [Candidatus Yonathbacteria bacterium]
MRDKCSGIVQLKSVKKNSNKIIMAVATLIVTGVGVFAYLDATEDMQNNDALGKSEENILGEVRFIRLKGCPEDAYKEIGAEIVNPNYFMCRSYLMDGEFVYYHGLRVAPSPIVQIQPLTPSFIATSSPDIKDTELMGATVIKGVDPKTFEIIYFDNTLSQAEQNLMFTFARDKDYLYWEGKRFDGIDPNTFAILGRGFIKDKDSVYYQEQKLKGSDPATFEFLDDGYRRDKNLVYFMGDKQIETLAGVDGSTFEIIDKIYTKDKNTVYYKREKLKNSDPDTFEILVGEYSKDKNNVYLGAKIIKNADSKTFTFLLHPYQKDGYSAFSKDKDNVYFRGDILKKADPDTFELVDYQFSKDAKSLYDTSRSLVPILVAQKGELISLGASYFKDDLNVWFRDTKQGLGGIIELGIVKIAQVDIESFETLSLGYAKDVNGLYFGKNKISNINPKIFVVIEGAFIRDSQSVYHRGVKLEGLNPDIAYIIEEKYNNNYITDDALVFYNSTQLVNVDVETFKIYKGRSNYSEDSERVYHMGKLLDGYVPGKMEFLAECNFVFVKNTSYLHRASEIMIVVPEPIKIDDETFEIIENCFAKDANQIITPNVKVIEGADVATFTSLGGLYSKDKNNVWYDDKLIKNADIETFAVRGSGY